MSKYHGLGAALCCVFTAQGKGKPQIPNVNLDIASIAEIPSCDIVHDNAVNDNSESDVCLGAELSRLDYGADGC